jgi:ferredoxin--NADP+ reductase
LEKPETFTWEEGSHMHIALKGYDADDVPNKEWVRHMSIMTLPEEGQIGFTTRLGEPISEFKEKLQALHRGDELVAFKIGSRMALRRTQKPIILLSMGVGLATFRPLIYNFLKDQTDIPKLVSLNVNATGDGPYKAALTQLHHAALTQNWSRTRADYYHQLNTLVDAHKDAWYYIVGSAPFISDAIEVLRAKGIADAAIVIDKKPDLRVGYFGLEG